STTCVRANPAVTLSPASQSVTVGNSATYSVTVGNKDNSYCGASAFALSAAMPAGLTASLGSSSLSLAPGASATTTLLVDSASSLPGGTYNFTVSGTNSLAPAYSSLASGQESLIGSLQATVTTDKPTYNRKQAVLITIAVSSSGSSVANASVKLTITRSDGQ